MIDIAGTGQMGSASKAGEAGSAAIGSARMPGQGAMWALVMIEAMTFSAYFVVYTLYYKWNPQAFLKAQAQLSLGFGVLNTLILLTSSWSIALCVQRSREGNYGAALRNCLLTACGGVVFSILKLYEWSLEIGKGLYFSTSEFFSYYYFFTGLHLLHVFVGFIALGVVYYQLSSPARRSQELVETGATYWHLVDFLWVIIFALLYVMR
jgi:nitric oxide reductase NorE protein